MSQMNNNEAIAFYDRNQDFVEVRANEALFPRLRDINRDDAFPAVKAMVVGAAILRGASMADSVIDLTAQAFLQEVWQDFPTLTLPEIGKAIRNGCFEKYGQVYGISAVSLYKMVQGYAQSEELEMLKIKAKIRAESDKVKMEQWRREHPDYYLNNGIQDNA